MPIQVNVPPRVRFWLYIAGALASTAVSYLVDKAWAGDAEVRLVANLVALINVLAAAKTDLSDPPLEEIANDAARDRIVDDYQGRHEAADPAPDTDRAAAIRARNRREGIS